MRTACASLAFLTLCSLVCFAAQRSPAPKTEIASKEGTFLGVLFRPIPQELRKGNEELARQGGVIVTHVLPDSPAEKATLRRNDILLRYNKTKIRDCAHFAELISNDQPGKLATLKTLRDGKTTETKVRLELGPILRIAPLGTARDAGTTGEAPGRAKQGGPRKVSVSALPMAGNRMQVTFEYYEAGKLKQVVCSGKPDQIDEQVKKYLPLSVRGMANLAVDHLRKLRFQKLPSTKPQNSDS